MPASMCPHVRMTITHLFHVGKLLYTVNVVLGGVQIPPVFSPLLTTFTAFTVIRYTVWFDPQEHILL